MKYIFVMLFFYLEIGHASIGDGPRGYMPTPIHKTSLSLYGVHMEGEQPLSNRVDGDITTNLGIFQPSYTHGLNVHC